MPDQYVADSNDALDAAQVSESVLIKQFTDSIRLRLSVFLRVNPNNAPLARFFYQCGLQFRTARCHGANAFQ